MYSMVHSFLLFGSYVHFGLTCLGRTSSTSLVSRRPKGRSRFSVQNEHSCTSIDSNKAINCDLIEAALNVLKGLDIGKIPCHAAVAKRYGIECTALAKVTNANN